MIRNDTDLRGVEERQRRLEAPRGWRLDLDGVSGDHPSSLTGHSSINLRIRGGGLARIAPWAVKSKHMRGGLEGASGEKEEEEGVMARAVGPGWGRKSQKAEGSQALGGGYRDWRYEGAWRDWGH